LKNKGLSLVEVVVSMVILSILALGISATMSFVTGSQGVRKPSGTLETQAIDYARQALEELKNAVSANEAGGEHGALLVDSDVTAEGGTLYQDYALPAGDFRDTHSGDRGYVVWDIDEDGDGTTDYKKVEVTVAWDDGT